MTPMPALLATGTSASNPNTYFKDAAAIEATHEHLKDNEIRDAVIRGFNLKANDSFVYHAIASVTLQQVQSAVDAGAAHGLHAWYLNDQSEALGNPSETDIEAYVNVFRPSVSAANALKSLGSNAKKGSLRFDVAENLLLKRHLDTSFTISKRKKQSLHFNPYLDFWSWSCQALQWGGPTTGTINVKTSHPVLPIFMHHFGCVVPSYESLQIISQVAKGRTIIDMGSGNGYWCYMLRAHRLPVVAIDNGQSVFRAVWVGDTVQADGANWLKARGGAKDDVLLLVYPVVGGKFFERMLAEYKGDAIVVAGTQNASGYTGFTDRTVDVWMTQERKQWKKTAQVPLPSFAGKDEGLFVFQKTSLSD